MQTDGQIVTVFPSSALFSTRGHRYAPAHVGIFPALADLTTLVIRNRVGPDGIIQLQIATACIIKGPDGVAPGGGQIVKIVIQIRIDRRIDVFATATRSAARSGWEWSFSAARCR